MPLRYRFVILMAISLVAWVAQGQGDPSASAINKDTGTVSIDSFVAPHLRITPMPLSERERRQAVPKRGMCSVEPAVRAPDALISGNGKMYVEVFGNPLAEQIIFHHERLIAPWKDGPLEAPQIASVLPEVRRLILDGQYRKANELALAKAAEGKTKPETANLSDHPAFDMRIDSTGQHAVHDYLRTIDFESGEVTVQWADDAGVWERRTFVSRPDNVVVQLLTAPGNAAINAKLTLDTSGVLGNPRRSATPRTLTSRAGMPRPLANPGATEVRFKQSISPGRIDLQGQYLVTRGNPGYGSATRVLNDGGTVEVEGDSLRLAGVHSLTLITRIEAWDDLKQQDVDRLAAAVETVSPNYQALLERHRPGQAEVIDRTAMNFGGTSMHYMSGEEMLTDQRTREGYNGALLENLFDMGRYWLYMRSGEFPPMWGHVNVNVNLQLSGAVMGNLPEAMNSYVHWTESLLPDSQVNAHNIFGARGALFPIHPTQRGGQLDHFAYGWPHEYWISAGGWMYSPIWDYYLASGDKELLRQHIMPSLREIALFYEDYLTLQNGDGKYIFVPSYSPENWPSNTDSSPAVINADMDIMVCREVLTHLIEGSETLGINADDIPRWTAMLAKLPPYEIDTDGSLREWAWPTLEEEGSLDHRHESHMYGVWPGDEISPDQSPELSRAAWLALRKRAQGNASAHGILHRALTAARLNDPYLLNFDLKQILEQGYVTASLTTLHNPYAYPAPDPQGALPTILMEMLVYSRPGVIGLLPALPATLDEGGAQGIVTRTQASIDDLKWNLKTGKLTVKISSRIDQTVKLYVRKGIESIETGEGVVAKAVAPGKDEVGLRLSKAHPVVLNISIGNKDTFSWMHDAAK